ncbi:BTAD domain-containing putative transcriptional regulator [Actinorhabdospora filicis]|nr:BTAD domain-containing putative transcriptional regulator [Actinorhabdospora filicis]
MLISLLGPVRVTVADAPVAVGGPRSRALLALLALNAGHPVGPDRLIDALYGDEPPAGAANALQSQISRLRRALPSGVMLLDGGGYVLNVPPEAVDATVFTALAREGSRALASGDHATAARVLTEAEGLWHGPALADLDDHFARAQAVRLDELRLTATEDRLEASLHLEPRALIAELTGLAAAHPLRERLHGQLMRALAADGRQAEALAVYERVREELAERLGADPSPELSATHLAVLRGTLHPFQPATVAPPVPATMMSRPPAQLTSFIGREEDLDRVTGQLTASRLVTLTGPGGAGKTRLAIEASAGGPEVCFVDLGALPPEGSVTRAVFTALGLREGGLSLDEDVLTRVSAALGDGAPLLILDNCEHVVDAAARFADHVLRACPRLRVLATSREALGITGETLSPVPPLAAPPEGETEGAAAYPAVRLFAERASAVRPDFTLDEATLPDVARVCHALDGLPLAVELAAARLRSLPVAEIAAHLDDRFRLLSRGSRTAQPRHQTLHAVVSWSWDLLEAGEQRDAARLSVFSGGFTAEAAAEVCELSTPDALDLLTGLADKSLLEVDGDRFRMLATIRAFAAARLDDPGAGRRHAGWFLRLARDSEPLLRSAEQLDRLRLLAAEHGNLGAALRWARENDLGLALDLTAYLVPYWWLRGLRGEGVAQAECLVKLLPPEVPADRGEEYVLAVLTAGAYNPEAPHLAPHMAAARAQYSIGYIPVRHPYTVVLWAVYNGPPDEGDMPMDELVELMRAVDDPWISALSHLGTAFYQWNILGDSAAAAAEAEACLAAFTAVGDRWGQITALTVLSDWGGQDSEAIGALLTRAHDLATELGAAEDQSTLRCLMGRVKLGLGDVDGARADFAAAGAVARRVGAREQIAMCDLGLARVALHEGDHDRARRLAEAALAECPTGWVQTNESHAQILIGLGDIALAAGDGGEARKRFREAFERGIAIRNYPVGATSAVGLASVALAEDDPTAAARLLGAARALRRSPVGDTVDEAADVERRVREALGETAYATAFEATAGLARAEAVRAVTG